MTFYGNPPQGDNNYNNIGGDPNNFGGNQQSQDPRFQDRGFQDQGIQDQGFQNQPSDMGDGGYDQGRGQQSGENYANTGIQGDTTDINTYGAGGDLGGRGQDDRGYDQSNFGQSGGVPGGKPSVGQRLKGGLEEVTGKVTRNPNMVERGEQRKEGW
ncbi:hypothetical protein WOLCODRAFT_150225 [Wolfiporia cocos MD-104 SS10]|uniref:Uncharacterized protein n=1 Tax=Wolfiporia cocos (strain MD-104) TaxID=742152 RepID=A0A2H3JDA7_WOLCO|nr:hypothetical protein WOLCODRAFT_150225 [Wolfiporia cocos MD-104 SS10]